MSAGTSQGGGDGPRPAEIFLRQFDRLILWLTVAGLGVALLYGGSAGACRVVPEAATARCDSAPWLGAVLALVFAMAALAVGAFAGFLFGLPRSFTAHVSRPDSAAQEPGTDDQRSDEALAQGSRASART